ncbi:MAG: DUF1564 domain-containing protein [Leptospiraceae bacterium]|nr:DUF1564 family protein [Leptospiraceae bacterium]MCK6381632.1 DUF1564 domain-containing protein [Leptospiraceae bacterium]
MNPEKYIETQSSLLVPAKYMDEFNKRTTGFSRRKYLHALLNRYRNVILWGTFEKMERVKKAYQEVGQNLQKKNFTPNNEDWIELGILADWLGTTKTALFTLLLVLDLAEWDIILPSRFFENGVPTPVTTIAGGAYLSKRKATRYNRLKRHKRPTKKQKILEK